METEKNKPVWTEILTTEQLNDMTGSYFDTQQNQTRNEQTRLMTNSGFRQTWCWHAGLQLAVVWRQECVRVATTIIHGQAQQQQQLLKHELEQVERQRTDDL